MKNKIIQFSMLLFIILSAFSCKNATQEVKTIEKVSKPKVFNNSKELVVAAKEEIKQISPEQLETQLKKGDVYVIDVREKSEFDNGSIPGAVLIPRGLLEFKIGKDVFWEGVKMKMPNKGQKIVIYCKSGGRGSLATKSLQQMGYKNVENLEGGYQGWVEQYPNKISVEKNKVN